MHAAIGSLTIVLVIVSTSSFAQVPEYVSFQGRLLDSAGEPIHDTVDLTTKLYQGGAEVYSQVHSNVVVDSGIFDVDLGPLSGVTFDRETELGVAVDTDPEMVPRTPFRSAPFSLGLRLPFLGRGAVDADSGLVHLWNTGIGAAVRVDSSAGVGFAVGYAANDGLRISKAGSDGLEVENADANGVRVSNAGAHGLRVTNSILDGVNIADAGDDGIDIDAAGDNGIYIGQVGDAFGQNFALTTGNGIQMTGVEGHGLYIGDAGLDGIRIDNARSAGIRIQQASTNGIIIYGTGSAAGNFYRSVDAPATAFNNHVVLMSNTASTDNNGHNVLALAVPDATPGTDDNFISFYRTTGVAFGRIEGNGSGGVQFQSGGADYAEYLPHAKSDEVFEPGDVVGVRDGRISRDITSYDDVMVVTGQAIVVGNAPPDDQLDGFETVSFIGQVPVKVLGPVASGDFLVASGRNDGIARALSSEEMSVDDLGRLVGRAWESSNDPAVKRVNAAVGLDQTDVLREIIARQQREIDALWETVKALSVP